jgi:hypothetical protein
VLLVVADFVPNCSFGKPFGKSSLGDLATLSPTSARALLAPAVIPARPSQSRLAPCGSGLRAGGDFRCSSQAGARRRGFEALVFSRGGGGATLDAATALFRVVHCDGGSSRIRGCPRRVPDEGARLPIPAVEVLNVEAQSVAHQALGLGVSCGRCPHAAPVVGYNDEQPSPSSVRAPWVRTPNPAWLVTLPARVRPCVSAFRRPLLLIDTTLTERLCIDAMSGGMKRGCPRLSMAMTLGSAPDGHAKSCADGVRGASGHLTG